MIRKEEIMEKREGIKRGKRTGGAVWESEGGMVREKKENK